MRIVAEHINYQPDPARAHLDRRPSPVAGQRLAGTAAGGVTHEVQSEPPQMSASLGASAFSNAPRLGLRAAFRRDVHVADGNTSYGSPAVCRVSSQIDISVSVELVPIVHLGYGLVGRNWPGRELTRVVRSDEVFVSNLRSSAIFGADGQEVGLRPVLS